MSSCCWIKNLDCGICGSLLGNPRAAALWLALVFVSGWVLLAACTQTCFQNSVLCPSSQPETPQPCTMFISWQPQYCSSVWKPWSVSPYPKHFLHLKSLCSRERLLPVTLFSVSEVNCICCSWLSKWIWCFRWTISGLLCFFTARRLSLHLPQLLHCYLSCVRYHGGGIFRLLGPGYMVLSWCKLNWHGKYFWQIQHHVLFLEFE